MRIRGTLRLRNDEMIAWREKNDLTQKQAADLCDTTIGVWGHLERLKYKTECFGKIIPVCKWEVIERIEEVTGIPVSTIAPMELWTQNEVQTEYESVADIPTAVIAAGMRQTDHLRLPAPEEVFAREEMHEAVGKVLKCLTPRQREVITLRFGLDGKGERSLNEISGILGIRNSGVLTHLTSAMRRLSAPVRVEKLLLAMRGDRLPDERGDREFRRRNARDWFPRFARQKVDRDRARRGKWSVELGRLHDMLSPLVKMYWDREHQIRQGWADWRADWHERKIKELEAVMDRKIAELRPELRRIAGFFRTEMPDLPQPPKDDAECLAWLNWVCRVQRLLEKVVGPPTSKA